MSSKLNEKAVQALGGSHSVDHDLGVATPGMLEEPKEDVKAEFPSFEPLKQFAKSTKNTYLDSSVWFLVLF